MVEKRRAVTHLMLERLIGIHKKIKSGCFPNCTQLAKEFNGGKGIATISRDIEFLRDRFGAPIEYDSSRKGYFYSKEYEIPLNSVSPDMMIPLYAAKILLSHFKNSPVYEEVSGVIDFLVDSQQAGNSSFIKRIALPPVPEIKIENSVWNVVTEALKDNSIIEFDYNGIWHNETSHRRFHPYQLIMDDGKYFIYGFSEERNDTRLFSLSRIKNPVKTNDAFTLPVDFEFETKCGGGKFGSFGAEIKEHYKIECYDITRQIVKECLWAENQKITEDENRNCTTIEFFSTQTYKVEEWVLSQGCNAFPLEPEWLYNSWKDHVQQMMKKIIRSSDNQK